MHVSRTALALLMASAPLMLTTPAAHADLAIKVSSTCTYADGDQPEFGTITSTITISGQGFASDKPVGKRGTAVVKLGQGESIDNYAFDKAQTDKDGSFTVTGTVNTSYLKQSGYPTGSTSTDIWVNVREHVIKIEKTPSVPCTASIPVALS